MNLAMQARLTMFLAAACGLFGLLLLLFWAGVGTGFGFDDAGGSARQPLPSVTSLEEQDVTMPEFGRYAEVSQRPLFSEDRRPLPPDEEGAEEAAAEVPAVPLQVQLTGVMITPDLKVALLRDRTTNQDVSLREGMPLPGNQSAWLLVEVGPRVATFRSETGDTVDVELTVAEGSGPPSPRFAPPAGPAAGAQKADAVAAEDVASATVPPPADRPADAQADLRARIEARRQQLRERAEQIRAQREAQKTQEAR